ncbi:MAG: galactokinase [Saprospiraceae bacterium]
MNNLIVKYFSSHFSSLPLIVRSPGRVNVIGEHTDYNEGFVLPAAIDKSVYVGVGERNDDEVHLYSMDFGEEHRSALSSLAPDAKGWPNYPLGVADQLLKAGYPLRGFNLVLGGDVPIGAGLSSSAALECAVIFALNELFGLGIDKLDMVKMAQRAEHTFAGVMCGIMDQFASMFGKSGHALKLDCRSLGYELVPLDMEEVEIVLLNTNIKHSLASSEYNTRRQQCRQGVEWIQAEHPHVKSLRDATPEMLERIVVPKDATVYKRCRYVLDENRRLLEGCEELKKGNLAGLGERMFQSHKGLSKDYEVSCPELDFLVDFAKNHPGVLGARMMGGGFGGCTINLVEKNFIPHLLDSASKAYLQAMGRELTPIVARIGEGTEVVISYFYPTTQQPNNPTIQQQ